MTQSLSPAFLLREEERRFTQPDSEHAVRSREALREHLASFSAARAVRAAAERRAARARYAVYERAGVRRASDREIRRLRSLLPSDLGGRRAIDPTVRVEAARQACLAAEQHLRGVGLWGPVSANILSELWRAA